jgi:hypothetical protein
MNLLTQMKVKNNILKHNNVFLLHGYILINKKMISQLFNNILIAKMMIILLFIHKLSIKNNNLHNRNSFEISPLKVYNNNKRGLPPEILSTRTQTNTNNNKPYTRPNADNNKEDNPQE